MEELKLLLLEKGDSQKNFVDKVNFNFSQIVSFEGGPYGKNGPEGKTGNKGNAGPTGSFGYQGIRGNLWTLSMDSPNNPKEGDYWMNPDNNNEVKVYNSNTQNWDLYSININGLDIFRDFGPLQSSTGISSKRGYFISLPYPLATTMVLSDSYLSDGSTIANPQYSKLVISTDSSNSERKILEFTKGIYHGTSFSEQTPYFNWSSGSGSGTYGLNFISSGALDFLLSGNLSLKSLTGSITLKGGDFSSVSLSSVLSINSTGLFSLNSLYGNLNINISDVVKSFLVQSKNLSIPTGGSNYSIAYTSFDVRTTGTTGSQSSMTIISEGNSTGNVYYKMDESYSPTRSGSTLFKAVNNTTDILEISGKGDFKVNKIVYPLHPLENPGYIQPGLTTIRYVVFNPTIALNGQTDSTSFNISRGLDFYVDPPATGGGTTRGISLWAPASGGSFGENGGWLNLLEDSEYINFRIHSSNPSIGFKYLGINTSNTKNSVPVFGNSMIDLGSGVNATSVEFTIMNISGSAGGTGGTDRWFKVLYQAYGGNLTTPICGELYTNGSTP